MKRAARASRRFSVPTPAWPGREPRDVARAARQLPPPRRGRDDIGLFLGRRLGDRLEVREPLLVLADTFPVKFRFPSIDQVTVTAWSPAGSRVKPVVATEAKGLMNSSRHEMAVEGVDCVMVIFPLPICRFPSQA